MKILSITILLLLAASCGKTFVVDGTSRGSSNSFSTNKELREKSVTDDKSCIDDALVQELGEQEIVKKIIDDADITFCNGLRVRVKIFKISSGEIRAYGYALSTSGRKSCLKQAEDFIKIPLLGFQGTLMGDKIKISLGGHEYDSKNKLVKGSELKGKFVKFKDIEYSGEIGFFEGSRLVCSSISNH